MTPDIADIYEDLSVDAKALAEAEEKRRDEEAQEKWRKQTEEARKQRAATYGMYMRRIAAYLPATAFWMVNDDNGHLIIDGVDVSWNVSIEKQRSSAVGRKYTIETGKMRIIVGDYGKRKSYPERKGGLHNYQQIAASLYLYACERIQTEKNNRNRSDNKNLVTALALELGDKYGSGYCGNMVLTPSSVLDKPVQVVVNFKRAMRPDEVRDLHEALVKLGLDK